MELRKGVFFYQLMRAGYDSPVAILEASKEELQRYLPKGLIDGLKAYVEMAHQKREGLLKAQEAPPPKGEAKKVKMVIHKEGLKVELLGRVVEFQPTTFEMLLLLAERPGQIVSKETLYNELYGKEGSDPKVYERQLADHKRKITGQLKKALKEEGDIEKLNLKELIKTKHRVDYYLNLKPEEVLIR